MYSMHTLKSAVFVIIFSCACMASGAGRTAPPAVTLVRIDNQIINPIIAQYVIDAITGAESRLDECVIIELDTPGGLLESTRKIVKEELNARIPIVVYISPRGSRAASAGVFMTMAADIAAMAPGTNIGAAHPVTPGMGSGECGRLFDIKKEGTRGEKDGAGENGGGKLAQTPDIMSEKIVSDTSAWIRAIAVYRGRNAEWAVKAVTESVSDTAEEALKDNVVDIVCLSLSELLDRIDGMDVNTAAGRLKLHTKGAYVKTIELNGGQKILNAISNPQVAYLLFMLGIVGIFIELKTPGIIFPGVAGAISLILALFAFQTLPINYAGVLLILLAVTLFAVEVKVASYGLLTIGGLICLVLGSLMLVKSQEAFMGVSLKIVLPVAAAVALIVIFLMTIVMKAQMRRSVTGIEGIVGATGAADSRIDPEGTVLVRGEIWNAESKEPVEKGEKVRIVGYEGLKLFVEREGETRSL